jgi:peptidoglycan/xylan/chitin deacetylase (PgdA/CDA1 family)
MPHLPVRRPRRHALWSTPVCLALATLTLSACSDEGAPPAIETQGYQASTLYPAIDFATRPNYVANNVIGLTFDDGPDSVNTPKVLDVLKAKGVVATFFINTNNFDGPVDSNTTLKNLIKRIVNEGHNLGSHSVSHPHLSSLSASQIEAEIVGVQNTVNRTDVLGASYPKLTLFRDPFGDPHLGGSPGQSAYDKVAPVVGKYAVHMGWAIDPADFNCSNATCVFNNVMNKVKTVGTGDYGMILMHSVQPQTAGAIGSIIDTLRQRGFVFKTAEEFVQAKFGMSSNQIIYGGACTPESNTAFCSRLGKNCGSVTANDNCGVSRTVTSCGSCVSPQTCGGGGTANVCGTPATCNQTPFGGTARAIPGTIQAEDYDNGGQNCAYSDTTTSNQGGQYRTTEAVDVQTTTDTGGGFNIGFVQAGEFTEYTVNVTTAGNYKLELRVAATATGKTVDVFMGSTLIANDMAVPNTGNYQTFATISVPSVTLSAGTQVLKVVFNQASQNLNWIKFTALTTCTPESNAAFCTRLGKNCGTVSGTDNCGAPRTVTSCGSCVAPHTCGGAGTPNVCGGEACVPEADASFCSRLGKNCGSVTGNDNCGVSRTVESCGSCVAPQTCGGTGIPNVCGEACVPESNATFCARLGKNCGTVSGTDNCGAGRNVSCGSCVAPETCGGAGTPNVCGICPAESDAAFCARLGKNCGSFSGTDNCGAARTASCGTCTAPATCSASNVCTSALGITNLIVNDTAVGNDGIANNTQWTVQASFAGGSGQRAFGDRTFTISALSGTATTLAGKPWIRTAADSKTYAVTSPPLATAMINGSFVNLAVDSRHATSWLTAAGFTNRGFAITVLEGTTARSYNVWRKAVTSGSTVTLPTINATTAPCYIVIVE